MENSATSGQYAAAGVWFLSPDARADVEERIAVATNGLPSVSAELLARDLYREAFRAEAITIRPRRHHPRNSIASRVLLPRYMLMSPTLSIAALR